MKSYLLTEEEFQMLQDILEETREANEKEDGGEELAANCARLENELLWQHAKGQRRPNQH